MVRHSSLGSLIGRTRHGGPAHLKIFLSLAGASCALSWAWCPRWYRPGCGSTGVCGRAFGGYERDREDGPEFALLEGADSVAQGSGPLELEVLGCFAHLGFELPDGLDELLFARDLADHGLLGRHGDVVGFDNRRKLHN